MKLRELFDNGTHTHVDENLMELTFHGSQCTKDCSGHRAGYAWSQARGGVSANSHSPSFNKGAEIGTRIIALNKAQRMPQRRMGTKKPPVNTSAQAAHRLAQGMHGTPDIKPPEQPVRENRIIHPGMVDVYFSPGVRTRDRRVVAKSIPDRLAQMLIRKVAAKFGVEVEDFYTVPVNPADLNQ